MAATSRPPLYPLVLTPSRPAQATTSPSTAATSLRPRRQARRGPAREEERPSSQLCRRSSCRQVQVKTDKAESRERERFRVRSVGREGPSVENPHIRSVPKS
eukprot:1195731-Prorocentrum_minimum.AAC.2